MADELARLARLDVYAADLWGFARRLANWECGTGPSADPLSLGEASEVED